MENLECYSDEEFHGELQKAVSALVIGACLAPSDNPQAVLLGGQSGSGKTTLHNVFRNALDGNVIVVNGDEYRSFHPRYKQLCAQYGIDAPAHTAAWAGWMVEAVIDALSIMGYNLVIEGTLRTSDVESAVSLFFLIGSIPAMFWLNSMGRRPLLIRSLALMAVKPEISLVSCQLRYEQMRIAGTEPRAVDPAHHLLIVEGIVDNLEALEDSGMFDNVSLYSRSERCLFSSADGEGRASEALRDVLFGDWTGEESRHLAYLEQRLEEAKARG